MDVPLDLQHAARSICRWMDENNVVNWRLDHLASRDELERVEKELTSLRAFAKFSETNCAELLEKLATLTEQRDMAVEVLESCVDYMHGPTGWTVEKEDALYEKAYITVQAIKSSEATK